MNGSETFMAETKRIIIGNQEPPTFKASLRLWSDAEPLAALVHASRLQWKHLYVKGQMIPARGKAAANVALQHYACSEDVDYANITQIASVLSQGLDEIESCAPPITALAKVGKVEAVLWIAIFGYDEFPSPVPPKELDARAKQAGVKILIENYTIMDAETGNPAKSFLAPLPETASPA